MSEFVSALHVNSPHSRESCVHVRDDQCVVDLLKDTGLSFDRRVSSFAFDAISFSPSFATTFNKVVAPAIQQFYLNDGRKDVTVFFHGASHSDKQMLYRACVLDAISLSSVLSHERGECLSLCYLDLFHKWNSGIRDIVGENFKNRSDDFPSRVPIKSNGKAEAMACFRLSDEGFDISATQDDIVALAIALGG